MSLKNICDGCGSVIEPPSWAIAVKQVNELDGGRQTSVVLYGEHDYCHKCVGRLALADVVKKAFDMRRG